MVGLLNSQKLPRCREATHKGPLCHHCIVEFDDGPFAKNDCWWPETHRAISAICCPHGDQSLLSAQTINHLEGACSQMCLRASHNAHHTRHTNHPVKKKQKCFYHLFFKKHTHNSCTNLSCRIICVSVFHMVTTSLNARDSHMRDPVNKLRSKYITKMLFPHPPFFQWRGKLLHDRDKQQNKYVEACPNKYNYVSYQWPQLHVPEETLTAERKSTKAKNHSFFTIRKLHSQKLSIFCYDVSRICTTNYDVKADIHEICSPSRCGLKPHCIDAAQLTHNALPLNAHLLL